MVKQQWMDEEDIKHTEKMKKLEKDVRYFKLMEKRSVGRERYRCLEQIKNIEEEILRLMKANIAKKQRENENMEKAPQNIIQMKKNQI